MPLNKYPTNIIAIPVIATKTPINLGLITFFSKIISGNDKAVVAIIKARAVPIPTPLLIKASAIGIVPNAFE